MSLPINWIHSKFHRVSDGWDPISPGHSKWYDDFVSENFETEIVDRLDAFSGGLAGKTLLDLGGGPGHFSVLFARRGARVTWHDVSRTYRGIAQRRAIDHEVDLEFSLGYLDDANQLGKERFDLVFCRVCWCYGRSDRGFARLVYSLLKPGGVGYIECNTPAFSAPRGVRKIQYWLNCSLWWKIGHPMPPRGRIATLIQGYPIERLQLDYSSSWMDVVLFQKR